MRIRSNGPEEGQAQDEIAGTGLRAINDGFLFDDADAEPGGS